MLDNLGENPEYPKKKEPRFIDLFSDELEDQLKKTGKIYRRKIERIRGAEQITKKMIVETRLPDGMLESIQEAKESDWVITGTKEERFVLTNGKFHSLYDSDGKGGWIPKERKLIGMTNPFNEPVRISAPWSTREKPAYQEGSDISIIVAEIAPDGTLTKDRYIIGDEQMLLNNYDLDTEHKNLIDQEG